MVHVRDSGGLAKSLLTSGQLFSSHVAPRRSFSSPSVKCLLVPRTFSLLCYHPWCFQIPEHCKSLLFWDFVPSEGWFFLTTFSLTGIKALRRKEACNFCVFGVSTGPGPVWVLRVLFDDITTRWQHGSVSWRSSPARSVLYGYWALGMWLVIIVFHVKHTWEFEDLAWKKNNLSH